MGFTPDGTRVFVSLRDENRVAVIDTASRSLFGTIEVGRNPIQVYTTPDGRFVYVANQGTGAEPTDTVSVIEVSSGKVVDTIRTGMGAHGVVLSSDGAWAFVTNIVDGTVSAMSQQEKLSRISPLVAAPTASLIARRNDEHRHEASSRGRPAMTNTPRTLRKRS